MANTIQHEVVVEKTLELCESIVTQPGFSQIKNRIEKFMGDDSAKSAYQSVVTKGDELNKKQQMGAPIEHDEIAAFDKQRTELFDNPVARDFIEAQQELHQLQDSVNQYLSKSFELGRIPTAEDMGEGSCGSGCGCH